MSHETERDSTRQRPTERQQEQKFVSDEDIMGRTDWLKSEASRRYLRSANSKDKEPKFLSDEDIVRRRVA